MKGAKTDIRNSTMNTQNDQKPRLFCRNSCQRRLLRGVTRIAMAQTSRFSKSIRGSIQV